MAAVYGIQCPVCGHEFEVMKGVLVSECGMEMPEERHDDTPFFCPECGKMFCLNEGDFRDNVLYTIMAD